jgi:hypothetical protein
LTPFFQQFVSTFLTKSRLIDIEKDFKGASHMAGKKQKTKIWKRILGLPAILLTLSVLMAPAAPAGAVPAETKRAPQTEPVLVRVLEPAEQAAGQTAEPETQAKAWGPVPKAAAPVEDTYFSDAVFLGDSRTEGFSLYSGLKEGAYLFSVGATVESVFTKPTEKTAQGTIPMLDALAEMDCSKVYVMLGVNELGWPRAEKFKEQYGKIIDRIREDHPNAQVAIQSLLPVSARQEAKKSYVNNERIAVYNQLLKELAQEKDCPYLNVAEAVSDETGCLRADWTFDGIHLNVAGCQAWLDYLKTHPAWPETT